MILHEILRALEAKEITPEEARMKLEMSKSVLNEAYEKPKGISLNPVKQNQQWLKDPGNKNPEFKMRDESKLTMRGQVGVAEESLHQELIISLANVLYVEPSDIDIDKKFIEMGLDSVIGMVWIKGINNQYGISLKTTKIYDYPSIREFAGFLEREILKKQEMLVYPDESNENNVKKAQEFKLINLDILPEQSAISNSRKNQDKKTELSFGLTLPLHSDKSSLRKKSDRPINEKQTNLTKSINNLELYPQENIFISEENSFDLTRQEAVAIIGMSGRYPDAHDLEKYWDNLVQGRNSIKEIPSCRWDVNKYYDPRPMQNGKYYCKWIGLLDDIEYFDPLFFNISPTEAELMDPQHRIFLQEGYRAFEDAGYSRQSLNGKKCGVYLGIMSNEYGMMMNKNQVGAMSTTGNSFSIAAARIPYFLNLKGPAIAIDTACSASLVANHLACQALLNHEIDMALVGGVSLYLIPESFIGMCAAGMLSPEGQCKTFDNSADGFVPGEGAGALVLKRLKDAERDNDNIYGIIIGSGINQDGMTNGITAPSVNSQIELEREIYAKYDIHPESISYVEMHGTGTKLGDPIELEALSTVHKEKTNRRNYCAIGSVKSNIGHTSAAAGVASVQKVLLCLKHSSLVPTLNFKTPNEEFDFEDSPFYINTELKPWESSQGIPRRACVSSFGFSGTNAHMVIEEYIPKENDFAVNTDHPLIFILSARTEKQLKTYAQSLLTYLETREDINLADMAYTLQVGREAMDYRMAFSANSREAIQNALEAFIKNNSTKGLLTARVKGNKEQVAIFENDEDAKALVKTWIETGKIKKVAELWVKGFDFDWNTLYGNLKPARISLPTYPFARQRCWIPETDSESSDTSIPDIADCIHPLLHQNISDLTKQMFSSTFTGREFFLKDHVVKGQRVLPGAAHLEMARAAVVQATGKEVQSQLKFKNIVWAKPVIVGEEPVKVNIGLYPEENDDIAFEIYCEAETGPIPYSQGYAVINWSKESAQLDINTLQAECSRSSLNSEQCYEAFDKMGIEYGAGHRGIVEIFIGSNQILAQLSLPSSISHTQDKYILHPALIDSALQSSIGLALSSENPMHFSSAKNIKPLVPFALQELEVLQSCTPKMWAYIRFSTGSKAEDLIQRLDIDLCDEQGYICARIKGYTSRMLESEGDETGRATDRGTLMIAPCWKEKGIVQEAKRLEYTEHLVMLGEELSCASIQTYLQGARIITLKSRHDSIEERFQNYSIQVFEEIYNILKYKPKTSILIQIVGSTQDERKLFSGLSGLLKTAHMENPKLTGQFIEVEPGQELGEIIKIIKENKQSPVDKQIRYENGKRYVLDWSEIEVSQEETKIPWKDRGVYLITGGAGGLGLILAKEIVKKIKSANLILTGRSHLNKDKQVKLKSLEELGAHVDYKRADVTNKEQVFDLIRYIKEKYGDINGIVHSAGVINDNLIINKNIEEVEEVLAPKVKGLVYLDQASQDLNLDFFILFSSIAGVMGNPGQADYAAANAFMDAYAEYRNKLMIAKKRQGKTLSINWPWWKEGGMKIDEENEKLILQSTGMAAMQTKTGMQVLYQAMACGDQQVMVVVGEVARIKQKLFSDTSLGLEFPKAVNDFGPITKIDYGDLPYKIRSYLIQEIYKLLKVNMEDIDLDMEFNQYGFDSITLNRFARILNEKYGLDLVPSILFEYPTLRSFADYLAETYSASFEPPYGVQIKDLPSTRFTQIKAEQMINRKNTFRLQTDKSMPQTLSATDSIGSDPIAIIGMSGIFPMADDLKQFWLNLQEGRDCISETPKGRWNWEDYNEFIEDVNRESIKKGGFIKGVDEFDPLFFGIAPKEAQLMDPQQRLLMTYIWKGLEDAGYSGRSLDGTNTAIFVGMASSGYSGLVFRVPNQGHSLKTLPSMGPNRMSHFLNIHGPSEPVETACSSSLVAIHRAIEVLRNGNCDMAIAGGINTILAPDSQISSSRAGVLSEDGKCKSFSNKANGYVRGEGVGMIVLKRLKDAELEGDHIYGVIRSSAVNHGGRSNSPTAPNPRAQAELLVEAYTKAGIDPRTVTYIEAHAAGTELGDSLEINGLIAAFRKLYEMTGESRIFNAHCGLATVKSNIGHLELAGGIAGVIKVLLQLKNKQLVKSLHCETVSPYIKLEGSPFYILQKNREWEALRDSKGEEIPRRAGISSFGLGGVNAHIVIEEYVNKAENLLPAAISDDKPALLVISGQNENLLKERVRQLLIAINEQNFSDIHLTDIAYTLQIGRESMEYRLALIVKSIGELQKKLEDFLEGREFIDDLYRGSVKQYKKALAVFAEDEDMQIAVKAWIAKGKYAKLADLWTKGLDLNWVKFYEDKKPRRISLPTYPFANKRYWVPENEDISGKSNYEQVGTSNDLYELSENKPYREDDSAPATPVQKVLADIWGKVLGVSNFGVNDNFFSLGGDSIFCLQVMSLAKIEGLQLSVKQLFEYPTISELSRQLTISEDKTKAKNKRKAEMFGLLSEEDRAFISRLS